jgi:hypothetical protein
MVAALLFAGSASAEPSAPRVLVLDMVLQGVAGSDASELPDLIALKLSHNGYETVPAGVLHRVLADTTGLPAACERQDVCRRTLARALKADFILATELTREKKGYRIEFKLLRADEKDPVKDTFETMRRRDSLPMNVDLCLRRLFVFPAPVAVNSPQAPLPIEPPPPPPPEPVAVKTAAPPPVPEVDVSQCHVDRDCVALGPKADLPPACFAEAWRGFPQNTCLSCVDGYCGCLPGRVACASGVGCVDLKSDPGHCGHCARSCAFGAACVDGECR